MPSKNRNLLKIGEAAELLGITVNEVRAWVTAGKLRELRTIGGHRRFRLGEVMAIAGQHTTTKIVEQIEDLRKLMEVPDDSILCWISAEEATKFVGERIDGRTLFVKAKEILLERGDG